MVQSIVDARKMDFEQIRVLARCYKNQGLNRIYLHWSAGPYNAIAPDYHFSIDGNGFVYNMNPLDKKLAATWRRNTGSINIALMCCADAVCYSEDSVDFGNYPPTIYQVQAMAKLVCILCEELDLDIDMDAVLTHGEVADIDGYGIHGEDPDMRWDLLLLPDSDGVFKPGGQVIRGMAIWYHYNHSAI